MWVGDDQLEYTGKSGYSILNQDNLRRSEAFQMLWTLKIAPSPLVCAWRVCLDRLPTRPNLVRRRVMLGNMQCPLC